MKIKRKLLEFLLISATTIFIIETIPRLYPPVIFILLPPHIQAILSFNLNFLKKYVIKKGAIMADDDLGYVLKSGTKMRMKTPDYNVEYFFSPFSFPSGRTIGINDVVEGEIFAVAVGDSFTFCSGVPQEKCWTEVLEEMLGKEVLNLGVFGYGAIQKFRMMKEALKIKPKIIIFQYGFGDMVDDSFFISGKSYPIPHPQNLFRKTENFFLRESVIISTIWVISFLFNFPKNVISHYYHEYAIQLHTDINTLKLEIQHFEEAKEILEESGVKFFVLFAPRDEFIERKICGTRKVNCITPHYRTEHFFKHDPHLNEHGNKFIAEEIFNFISSAENSSKTP